MDMTRASGRLVLCAAVLALVGCDAHPVDPSERLAAPENVTAYPGPTLNEITLQWPPLFGANSYTAFGGMTPEVSTASSLEQNGGPPSVQRNLTPNTNYYYAIAAINGNGRGALSAVVHATTSGNFGIEIRCPDAGAFALEWYASP
jgi:hypothetical protein